MLLPYFVVQVCADLNDDTSRRRPWYTSSFGISFQTLDLYFFNKLIRYSWNVMKDQRPLNQYTSHYQISKASSPNIDLRIDLLTSILIV